MVSVMHRVVKSHAAKEDAKGVWMKQRKRAASYVGLTSASTKASAIARAASRKRDTPAELTLRRTLWRHGLRYRVDVKALPGRPDIVFASARVVVFCDGDFWHGRKLRSRLARLSAGHNAAYWVEKIRGNVRRDRRNNRALKQGGWQVLRFWETDVLRDVEAIAAQVILVLRTVQRERT
jgi:DNA mismatch endonuclease, patch repair protein